MTQPRENYFGLLRLVAASMVMFSHAFRVFGGLDPTAGLVQDQDISSLGVMIFFGVSGYLVMQSGLRSAPQRFLLNRSLRIFPGLVVCVLLTTFVIGALGSTLTYGDYIRHPRTWLYLLNLPLFALQTTLPGTFAANPWVNHVNGSLWTLAIEVSAYGVVFLACFWVRRAKATILATMVGAAVAFVLIDVTDAPNVLSIHVGGVFLFYLNIFGFSYLLFTFCVGAALSWMPRTNLWIAAALVAVAVVFPHMLIIGAATAYTAIAIGKLAAPFRLQNDISYGLYLYHLPVLQLTWSLSHDRLPVAGQVGLGLLATVALAYASWTLVERPFLSLKGRTVDKAYRSPEAARST